MMPRASQLKVEEHRKQKAAANPVARQALEDELEALKQETLRERAERKLIEQELERERRRNSRLAYVSFHFFVHGCQLERKRQETKKKERLPAPPPGFKYIHPPSMTARGECLRRSLEDQ